MVYCSTVSIAKSSFLPGIRWWSIEFWSRRDVKLNPREKIIHLCKSKVLLWIWYILISGIFITWSKLADHTPFSVATRCNGQCYSFLWIAPLTLDPYLIMLSSKAKKHQVLFLGLWYESTGDWTSVSWAIGKHSNHNAKRPVIEKGAVKSPLTMVS